MIIKELPEDFRVNEILSIEKDNNGKYILCKIKRISMDHFTMISLIAQYFRIPEKKVGFAGIKDRNAVITQYISLPLDCNSKFAEEPIIIQAGSTFLSIDKMNRINNPLSIGSLEANEFEIVIKNVNDNERESFDSKITKLDNYLFPNYFGDQRFGVNYNNVRIGYHILKRNFSNANTLLGLEESNNPLAELRRTPRRLRMLMISAFQSAVFNAVLSSSIEQKKLDILKLNNEPLETIILLSKDRKYNDNFNYKNLADTFPLPGLGMERNSDVDRILDYLSISERDFAIRQMPELMFEPATRNSYVKTTICHERLDNNTFKIKFKLPKGSYATILVESLFH